MGAQDRWAIARIATFVFCSCFALPFVALGQSLQGHFFVPKSTYLVGEPVFVIFEVTNKGKKTAWIDSGFGQPCFDRENIEVARARRVRHGWKTALDCYGGWGGSCAGSETELKGGQTHSERILVNHYYQLDQPGAYEVRIARKVSTYLQDSYSHSGPTINARADIEIRLLQGTEQQLKAAFQPVLKDLKCTHGAQRVQVVQAVTELAQPFTEQTILDLSKNSADVWASIEGLYKINKPKARGRLADLAEHSNQEGIRERAMQALAALGDKSYVPLFYRLTRSLKGHEKDVAIESAGLLGGGQAVPFLSSLLESNKPAVRMAAIRGLAGTASRSALAPLIAEIRDADPNVRQIVNAALAQLTHLSTSRNALDFVPNPAQTFQKWHGWWLSNGFRAPIYGPTECAEPTPLN